MRRKTLLDDSLPQATAFELLNLAYIRDDSYVIGSRTFTGRLMVFTDENFST
jgi:hypothetical protein